MKNLTLLIAVLIAPVMHSQISSGIATYSSEFKSEYIIKDRKINPRIETLYSAIAAEASNLTSILVFNKNASKFEVQETMAKDGNELAAGFASNIISPGIFYRSPTETIQKESSAGRTFLIKLPQEEEKWTITPETDVKKGFKVIKALRKRKFVNPLSGQEISMEIEAWFAPELNFSYGPKGQGGLPGLILKLSEGPVTYTLSEIKFNEKIKNKIDWPGGKTITLEEYSSITGKKMKQIF